MQGAPAARVARGWLSHGRRRRFQLANDVTAFFLSLVFPWNVIHRARWDWPWVRNRIYSNTSAGQCSAAGAIGMLCGRSPRPFARTLYCTARTHSVLVATQSVPMAARSSILPGCLLARRVSSAAGSVRRLKSPRRSSVVRNTKFLECLE